METTQEIGKLEYTAEPSLEAACRRFTDAFNRHDAKELAACWAESGTLISPSGETGNGRDGVEQVFRGNFETILVGVSTTARIVAVRRLGPELAFCDLDQELHGFRMPDGSTGTMKVHVALLARRRGSGWEWLDTRPYVFVPRPPSVH